MSLKLVRGPFSETLPPPDLRRLALLRVDTDSYESTKRVLATLYSLVAPGGVVIIDDWHLPCCFTAVMEYRATHGVTAPLVEEAMNMHWTKESP